MVSKRQKISNIFGPLSPTMKGFNVLLNDPYNNIKKMICQKKSRCSTVQGLIRLGKEDERFLKGGNQKGG